MKAKIEINEDDWQVLLAAVENLRGGGSDPTAKFRIAKSVEELARRYFLALDAARKSP